jgi:hypothetical protein
VRLLVFAAFVSSCSGRCGHDPPAPAPIRVDLPPLGATSVGAPPLDAASESVESVDAACLTAHDDALAKYRAFCDGDDNTNCPAPDADPDPIGRGSLEPDLDGDGVREIQWGWGSGGVNTETHLYRGNPGCAVHLAELVGNASIKALATRHEGYADISADDTSGCEGMCSCNPDVHVLVFRAGQYREDPKRFVQGTARPCVPPP